MKRALLLSAVILMVLFTFVGCSNNTSSQSSNATVADNKTITTVTSQGNAASKAKLSGQSGNAVNAAEEIEKILNGMDMKNDSPNIVVDNGSSSSSIDNSSKELNAILGNGSDNVTYK